MPAVGPRVAGGKSMCMKTFAKRLTISKNFPCNTILCFPILLKFTGDKVFTIKLVNKCRQNLFQNINTSK